MVQRQYASDIHILSAVTDQMILSALLSYGLAEPGGSDEQSLSCHADGSPSFSPVMVNVSDQTGKPLICVRIE